MIPYLAESTWSICKIKNNFGFVLAQRTNGQNLSRIDWVSNFLWIFKEIHPIFSLDPCHKRLEAPQYDVKKTINGRWRFQDISLCLNFTNSSIFDPVIYLLLNLLRYLCDWLIMVSGQNPPGQTPRTKSPWTKSPVYFIFIDSIIF